MRKILFAVVCIFLCGCAFNNAFAQTISQDVASLEKSAAEGDLGAQTDLGAKYILADGVERDFDKGYELISDAAYKGYDNAMNWMGVLVNANEPHNVDKAIEWYTKAAELGHHGAQSNLAGVYLNQNTLEGDMEAFKWYSKAAEGGDERAQNKLGAMYLEGRGVAMNRAKGVEWITKSAEQGYDEAQWNLGIIYKQGIGVDVNMTKALEWYVKAAESNDNPELCERIGDMYAEGLGAKKDYAEAFKWYMQAAGQNHSPAQYQVARYYWEGLGVKKDKVQAYVWAFMSVNNEEQWQHIASLAKELLSAVTPKLSKKELNKANDILTAKGVQVGGK